MGRVGLIQQLFAAAAPSRVIVDLLPCVTTGRATASMLATMQHERDAVARRPTSSSRRGTGSRA